MGSTLTRWIKREIHNLGWFFGGNIIPPDTFEVHATYAENAEAVRQHDLDARVYPFKVKSGPLAGRSIKVVFRSGPGFSSMMLTENGLITSDPVVIFNGIPKNRVMLLINCAWFAKEGALFNISFTLSRKPDAPIDRPFLVSNFDFQYKPSWEMPDLKSATN